MRRRIKVDRRVLEDIQRNVPVASRAWVVEAIVGFERDPYPDDSTECEVAGVPYRRIYRRGVRVLYQLRTAELVVLEVRELHASRSRRQGMKKQPLGQNCL